MSGSGAVVCVTGASGFIASWLVKLLLERGYTVKATILNLNDPSMTRHLISLAGAKERLHLFEANLNEDGSFDPAVDGCEGIFHTASPVALSSSDPKAQLLDPAVKGTLNVLRSCAKVPSIKRVVLTSSMTSVCPSTKRPNPGVVIDESWFSDPVYLEESKIAASKDFINLIPKKAMSRPNHAYSRHLQQQATMSRPKELVSRPKSHSSRLSEPSSAAPMSRPKTSMSRPKTSVS